MKGTAHPAIQDLPSAPANDHGPTTGWAGAPRGLAALSHKEQEDGSAPRAIRVLVVDDHSLFADLLSAAIDGENDFESVGTVRDVAGAVAQARRLRPDLAVVDIQLEGENGLDAVRQIRAVLPDIVIVVVSGHRDPKWVVRASQAGGNAFAPKTGSLPEILKVLRAARAGSMLIAPSTFSAAPAIALGTGPTPSLTGRERQVLDFMARGLGAAEIASLLQISVHTCRGYVKTIHTKLDVRSQLEAVVKAQRLGLVPVMDAIV